MQKRLKAKFFTVEKVSFEEPAIERFTKTLQRLEIPEEFVTRYREIMSTSNQLDHMNINFLAYIVLYIFYNEENPEVDILPFIPTFLSKKNYSEEEYNFRYLNCVASVRRYCDHFFLCKGKSSLPAFKEVQSDQAYNKFYDLEERYLFNEFD